MIMTLGLFLSSKERKMSCLIHRFDDAAIYEPDLFLQGLILVQQITINFIAIYSTNSGVVASQEAGEKSTVCVCMR